jgi:hypothetical protein
MIYSHVYGSRQVSVGVYALNPNVLLTYNFIMNKVVGVYEYMTYLILHT